MEERNYDLMVEETENTEVTNYYDEADECSGNGGVVALIVAAGAGLVGGGFALWKNRDKIKDWYQERQIAKAEKKMLKCGCKVVRISEDEIEAVEEVLDDVDVEETE